MKKINTLDYKVLQLLGRLEFFSDFSLSDKQVLVNKAGMIVLAEPGEYVIREGTVDPAMYVPLTGALEVRMTDASGREIPIAKILAGDTVGEIAFLTEAPRSASVVATQQTLLFRCTRAGLKSMTQATREKIKDQLIVKLVERLRQKNLEASNLGDTRQSRD